MAHELAHTLQQRPGVISRQPVASPEAPAGPAPEDTDAAGDTDARTTQVVDALESDRGGHAHVGCGTSLSPSSPPQRRALISRSRAGD